MENSKDICEECIPTEKPLCVAECQEVCPFTSKSEMAAKLFQLLKPSIDNLIKQLKYRSVKGWK